MIDREMIVSGIQSIEDWPTILKFSAGFFIYTVLASLPVPAMVPLSLLIGWMLGFYLGFVCVSFASVLGATITFLASRYLFRDWLHRKFGANVEKLDSEIASNCFPVVIALRLCPGLPFFAINASLGLTRITTRNFWLASQIGMVPATLILVGTGSQVPSLQQLLDSPHEAFNTRVLLSLLIGALLMVCIPIAIRLRRKRLNHVVSAVKE